MRKMLLTALQLQGNMKDNVEYKIVAICSAGGRIAVEGRPSITLTFEDMQGTSIDLSIEMSEHVQLVQKRGQKY
jgi:hypothetical protein